MKKIVKTLSLVFSDSLYSVVALLIAIFVFLFNVLTPNVSLLWHTLLTQGIGELFLVIIALVEGSFYLPWYSATLMILVSILTGLVFALIIFKIRARMAVGAASRLGTVGMVLGVIAPGCSSCGIGLLAIIGASSAFSGLPLKGLEVGLLGLALLIGSMYMLLQSIDKCESCQVVLKPKKVK